jgi:hypothetical protein
MRCRLGAKVTSYRVRGSRVASNTFNSYSDLGGNSRAYDPLLDIYIPPRKVNPSPYIVN